MNKEQVINYVRDNYRFGKIQNGFDFIYSSKEFNSLNVNDKCFVIRKTAKYFAEDVDTLMLLFNLLF